MKFNPREFNPAIYETDEVANAGQASASDKTFNEIFSTLATWIVRHGFTVLKVVPYRLLGPSILAYLFNVIWKHDRGQAIGILNSFNEFISMSRSDIEYNTATGILESKAKGFTLAVQDQEVTDFAFKLQELVLEMRELTLPKLPQLGDSIEVN